MNHITNYDYLTRVPQISPEIHDLLKRGRRLRPKEIMAMKRQIKRACEAIKNEHLKRMVEHP